MSTLQYVRTIKLGWGSTTQQLDIGVVGENEATLLLFDCTEVQNVWPEAVYSLTLKRRDLDETGYVVLAGATPNGKGFVQYALTLADTVQTGFMDVEFSALLPDGSLAKNVAFVFFITPSINAQTVGDVDPQWLVFLSQKVAEVNEAKASVDASFAQINQLAGEIAFNADQIAEDVNEINALKTQIEQLRISVAGSAQFVERAVEDLKTFQSQIEDDLDNLGDYVDTITSAKTAVEEMFDSINTTKDAIQTVYNTIQGIQTSITADKDAVAADKLAMTELKDGFTTLANTAKSEITGLSDTAKSDLTALSNAAKSDLTEIADTAKSDIADLLDEITSEVAHIDEQVVYIEDMVQQMEDLLNSVEELTKGAVIDVQKSTAEILSTIQRGYEDFPIDLRVETEAQQNVTVLGKNLLDAFRVVDFRAQHTSISFVVGTDNIAMTVNTTSVGTVTRYIYSLLNIDLVSDSVYTLRGNIAATSDAIGVMRLYWVDENLAFIGSNFANITSGSISFTVPARPANAVGVALALYAAVSSQITAGATVTFTQMQIEEGNTATPYEPFIPNSPSINYPAPFTGFDNVDVVKSNDNLLRFHLRSGASGGLSWVVNEDNSITIGGTLTANSSGFVFWNYAYEVPIGVPLTLSGSTSRLSLRITTSIDPGTSYINTHILSQNGSVGTGTLEKLDEGYRYRIYAEYNAPAGTVVSPTTIKPLLNFGSTVSDFEAGVYEDVSLIPQQTLYGFPFVRDEISNEGKEIHRTALRVLDGTETWSTSTLSRPAGTYAFATSLPLARSNGNATWLWGGSISSHFTPVPDGVTALHVGGSTVYTNTSGATNFYVCVSADIATTNTEFRAWVAANPIQVLYELAVPIEYSNSMFDVRAFEGVNNFFSTQPIASLSVQQRFTDNVAQVGTEQRLLGEAVRFEDSLAGNLVDVSFDLSAKQNVTVQGKNLYELGSVVFNNNGATSSHTLVDGVLTIQPVSPGSTNSGAYHSGTIMATRYGFLNGKTITFSFAARSDTSRVFRARIGNPANYLVVNTTTAWQRFSMTVTNFTAGEMSFYSYEASNLDSWQVKEIQFEEGSIATPYEPFVPNSPSIGYPAVISGYDNIGITHSGTNLWNDPLWVFPKTHNGVTMTRNANGEYVLNGTLTNNFDFRVQFPYVLPAGTYTVSANNPVASPIPATNVQFRSPSNTFIPSSGAVLTAIQARQTFTAPDGIGYMQINTTQTSGTMINFIVKPQLESGSVVSPFVPFAGYEEYSLIPQQTLFGLPNAMDRIGTDGIEIHRTGFHEFSVGVPVTNTGSTPNPLFAAVSTAAALTPNKKTGRDAGVICSHFPFVDQTITTANTPQIINNTGTNTNFIFVIEVETLASYGATSERSTHPAAFTAWLNAQATAGTPVQVVYERTTPAQSQNEPTLIQTLRGMNNIINDKLVLMWVTVKNNVLGLSQQIARLWEIVKGLM